MNFGRASTTWLNIYCLAQAQHLRLTKFNNPIIVYHKRRKEASGDVRPPRRGSGEKGKESSDLFWGPEVVRPQHPRASTTSPQHHHPLSLKGPSIVGTLAPSFTFHISHFTEYRTRSYASHEPQERTAGMRSPGTEHFAGCHRQFQSRS
jgi:hypothetical protein